MAEIFLRVCLEYDAQHPKKVTEIKPPVLLLERIVNK
jgi:hypothetical protein